MLNRVVLGLTVIIILSGCVASNSSRSHTDDLGDVSSEVLDGFNRENVKALYVLPVISEKIGSQTFGTVDDQATESLLTALSVYTQLEISGGKKEHPSNALNDVGYSKERLFKIASETSALEGKVPVLFCLLQKTSERSGGQLGSEVTAQAKYRMWLYDGVQGKVVWSSAFRTKEEAASENLFSLGSRLSGRSGFASLNDLIASAFRGSAKSLDKLLRNKK